MMISVVVEIGTLDMVVDKTESGRIKLVFEIEEKCSEKLKLCRMF